MSSNATTVAIDLTLVSVFDTAIGGNSNEKEALKHHDEDSAGGSKKCPHSST